MDSFLSIRGSGVDPHSPRRKRPNCTYPHHRNLPPWSSPWRGTAPPRPTRWRGCRPRPRRSRTIRRPVPRVLPSPGDAGGAHPLVPTARSASRLRLRLRLRDDPTSEPGRCIGGAPDPARDSLDTRSQRLAGAKVEASIGHTQNKDWMREGSEKDLLTPYHLSRDKRPWRVRS